MATSNSSCPKAVRYIIQVAVSNSTSYAYVQSVSCALLSLVLSSVSVENLYPTFHPRVQVVEILYDSRL